MPLVGEAEEKKLFYKSCLGKSKRHLNLSKCFICNDFRFSPLTRLDRNSRLNDPFTRCSAQQMNLLSLDSSFTIFANNLFDYGVAN